MQISQLNGFAGFPAYQNAALVIAHPGHELKVFGWLSESTPRVFILTDGSGSGVSRLGSSKLLLSRTGAVPGEIFGQLSDAEMYQAIFQQDIPLFLRLVDRLARSLVEHAIDCAAGDATEEFNPAHDICRALLNAAIEVAQRVAGSPIANYEFCLTEWEQHCSEVHDHRCLHLRLNDALFRAKLRAAADYNELKAEIQQALTIKGEEYFRTECLREITAPFSDLFPPRKPYYEIFGEQRVAEGKYDSVIRYEQHIVPILRALHQRTAKAMEHSSSYVSARKASGSL